MVRYAPLKISIDGDKIIKFQVRIFTKAITFNLPTGDFMNLFPLDRGLHPQPGKGDKAEWAVVLQGNSRDADKLFVYRRIYV